MLIPLSAPATIQSPRVWLIPVPIAEGILAPLSPQIAEVTAALTHYVVENARTARRFLKLLHPSLKIESLTFSEIDKHTGPDVPLFTTWLKSGLQVGIMSESGCPGIADPGSELVAVAHHLGIKVVPLAGPSSILLALMASGLNGQGFAFRGYIAVKEPQRSQQIKDFEIASAKERQTQIFIETPYRNQQTFADLLRNLKSTTRLCLAIDLTGPNESVQTRMVAKWRDHKPNFEKHPMVFLFLA
jgi:16S rRNA (cytidine1402-2'-O)-methyltransferase